MAQCLACASSYNKLLFGHQDPELYTQSSWILQPDWIPQLTFNCKSLPGRACDGCIVCVVERLSHTEHPTLTATDRHGLSEILPNSSSSSMLVLPGAAGTPVPHINLSVRGNVDNSCPSISRVFTMCEALE